MTRGLHLLIADAIVHETVQWIESVCLTISDTDSVRKIDRLAFDHGKTEIWGPWITP